MSEWISVKKYLPEEWKMVLFISEMGAYFIGWLRDGVWCYSSTGKPINKHFNIKAWMPLPEPPENTD